MNTENFNYKNFAASMAEQALELLPNDISDESKDYIKTNIYNFTFIRIIYSYTFSGLGNDSG